MLFHKCRYWLSTQLSDRIISRGSANEDVNPALPWLVSGFFEVDPDFGPLVKVKFEEFGKRFLWRHQEVDDGADTTSI